MKYTTKSHFSREEKFAIISEYKTSPLSGSEICAKYGIKHQSLLCVWRFLNILKLFVNNPYSIYEAQEHAVSVLLLVLSASLLSDDLTDGLFAQR